MKPLGRKTVKSSNRQRAAQAGRADDVIAGRRNKVEKSVIASDSPQEVYGVLLSERARMGESNPTVPAEKTKNTRSLEPKNVPGTGVAKDRKGK